MKTKNYKFMRALVCTLLSILLCAGFIVAPQAKALADNAAIQSTAAESTTADATNSQNTTSSTEGTTPALNDSSTSNKHYTDVSVVPLEQQLKNTEGISNVEYFTDQSCKEGYSFTIEQPLDWDDASKGKFTQRVWLRFNSQTGINIYECGGYTGQFANSAYSYFGNSCGENFIGIEYRFFDGSRPAGLENTAVYAETWKLCNNYQMANDIHNIYQKLSTILAGKSALFGISKGGYVANYQAYFQDTYNIIDFDAFYPFCAPFCKNINDTSMFDFILKSVGNDWFGAEKAAQYRDAIFNYEMECYKYKPQLSVMMDAAVFPAEKKSSINTDFFGTTDAERQAKLFDYVVLNYGESVWQSYQNEDVFTTLQQVVALPETTEAEIQTKINALYQVSESSFTGYGSLTFYWDDTLLAPYYIEANAFMGENTFSFDKLRTEIPEKEWGKDTAHQVTISAADEQGLGVKAGVKADLRSALLYNQDEYDKLLAWNSNCKQNVFRVYGALDPWYATRIPDVNSNGNVHNYVAPGMGHYATPLHLTASDLEDFVKYYKELLFNSISDMDVTLDGASFTYTGAAITPAVSVNMNGVIVSPDNYTVEYLNNVEVGSATVRVTGTRGFSGTIDKTFTINAAEGELVSPASTASTADHNSDVAWPLAAVLVVSGVTCAAAVRRRAVIRKAVAAWRKAVAAWQTLG